MLPVNTTLMVDSRNAVLGILGPISPEAIYCKRIMKVNLIPTLGKNNKYSLVSKSLEKASLNFVFNYILCISVSYFPCQSNYYWTKANNSFNIVKKYKSLMEVNIYFSDILFSSFLHVTSNWICDTI